MAEQKSGFNLLLQQLQQAGLLESAEAAALQPNIRFELEDLREDKSRPLVVANP